MLLPAGSGLPDSVGPAGLLFRRCVLANLPTQLCPLIVDANLCDHLRHQASNHLAQFQETSVCRHYLRLIESVLRRP
jgi:hypothetical protein